ARCVQALEEGIEAMLAHVLKHGEELAADVPEERHRRAHAVRLRPKPLHPRCDFEEQGLAVLEVAVRVTGRHTEGPELKRWVALRILDGVARALLKRGHRVHHAVKILTDGLGRDTPRLKIARRDPEDP